MKIIIQHGNKENPSVKRIIEEGEKQGHNMFLGTHNDFEIFFKEQIETILFNGKELKKENFDILYLRQIASKINTYKVIAEYAQKNGVKVIDYEGIQNYGEKINTYYNLAGKLVNLNLIPSYSLTGNKISNLDLDFPVILKPINGKEGKGVKLINNKSELEKEIKENKEEVIIQKFIENDGDIRILIVGDKILGAMKRFSTSENEFRNNISLGGQAEIFNLDKKYFEELLNINKILGYDISGIDLIFDKNNPEKFYIMEVNKGGQFDGFEKTFSKNVAKEIINFITKTPN